MKTQDAILHFGSREALAAALSIDRSATYHWGETVPLPRQYQLQVITDGKLVAIQPVKVGAGDTAPDTNREAA